MIAVDWGLQSGVTLDCGCGRRGSNGIGGVVVVDWGAKLRQ